MAVVAIVTSAPPLVEGGHLVIARALERACVEAGHRAGVVTTPSNRFGRQGAAYLANWLTDVGITGDGTPIDRVISLRFPSYAVRHAQHVCWLNHTMREYYDLWDRFAEDLSMLGRTKELMRRTTIRAVDSYLLGRRLHRVYAQSDTVRQRLRRFHGVAADVIHPPAPPRPYRCDEYGGDLLFVSRLSRLKRADLVLRALARPEAGGGRLTIAGEGEDRPRLERLVADLHLADRVTFVGRLSETRLVDLLARCRAVVFPPLQEDFGFVTVEAFASGKAVITCEDSGGPAELVQSGVNGMVTAPEPAALAGAMGELSEDAGLAERMGTMALQQARVMTWRGVIDRLLAD